MLILYPIVILELTSHFVNGKPIFANSVYRDREVDQLDFEEWVLELHYFLLVVRHRYAAVVVVRPVLANVDVVLLLTH